MLKDPFLLTAHSLIVVMEIILYRRRQNRNTVKDRKVCSLWSVAGQIWTASPHLRATYVVYELLNSFFPMDHKENETQILCFVLISGPNLAREPRTTSQIWTTGHRLRATYYYIEFQFPDFKSVWVWQNSFIFTFAWSVQMNKNWDFLTCEKSVCGLKKSRISKTVSAAPYCSVSVIFHILRSPQTPKYHWGVSSAGRVVKAQNWICRDSGGLRSSPSRTSSSWLSAFFPATTDEEKSLGKGFSYLFIYLLLRLKLFIR